MLLSSMSPQKRLVEKKKITASAGRYSWGERKIKPHSSCNPKETNKKPEIGELIDDIEVLQEDK